jgi:hypothetical protein
MNAYFPLIHDLAQFLEPLDAKWFVSGGWAIDMFLGRVTRARCDLDISVPHAERLGCIEFFLSQGWQIEGKLGDGFKTIRVLSDCEEAIHYFWSFPKGVGFICEYHDEWGNRRIDYQRETQTELDYLEVFFDRCEHGDFIYHRDPQITRDLELAILERDGVRYLAPELVLLFKSKTLSKKNTDDFQVVIDYIDRDAKKWLIKALSRLYEDSHPWLDQLQD